MKSNLSYKSELMKKLLVISMSFFLLSLNAQAEDKKISIDPTTQKVTTEFVHNGCFTYSGYHVVKVDGFKMMIIQNDQSMSELIEKLNNAKAEKKIVDVNISTEEKAFGSYQTFGSQTHCKDEVAEVKSISSRDLDQEKGRLKSELAQCRQTIMNISTNINMSTGSADYLESNIDQAISFNSGAGQQQ